MQQLICSSQEGKHYDAMAEKYEAIGAKSKFPNVNIYEGFSEDYNAYQTERQAVSNAINGVDVLLPETRDHILEVARRLHYVPNLNGRHLKAQSTIVERESTSRR